MLFSPKESGQGLLEVAIILVLIGVVVYFVVRLVQAKTGGNPAEVIPSIATQLP